MIVKVKSSVDDMKGLVDASFLEMLIKNGTLRAFKRKGKWVMIERGNINIRHCSANYTGPERRRIIQLSD